MKKKNFEDALKDLEQITRELDEGALSLEDSLDRFEKGIKLVEYCSRKLNDVQKKVDTLLKKDGALNAVPFEDNETE
ncbi:MAG: exodeoxyribonuclease VII small subunit [Deltaproteobacteria bacterium RIFOXYD12_FULL_57_12]|nr:MAG: exodeoxyribonuclease VII small subunit [Deltaproteobacteria bacterium RIFOXYD12_FULL_57_12]